MDIKIEKRSIACELRTDGGDKFQIRGLAAGYNRLSKDLGGFREKIAPGAFKRALSGDGTDVKCLFNHDANFVLGRTSNGTLKLSDSPDGLRFACQLDPAQQSHRDLHASVKRGDIDECSFAFSLDGDEGDSWEDAKDESGQRFKLRTLRKVNLFDVSAVTFPAYGNGATNVAARSADYTITKHLVWAAEAGPQGESLLADPWAVQRAELRRIDDKFETDRLRARLDRVGAEIARGE